MKLRQRVYGRKEGIACPNCRVVLNPVVWTNTGAMYWYKSYPSKFHNMTVDEYECVCPGCGDRFTMRENRKYNTSKILYYSIPANRMG